MALMWDSQETKLLEDSNENWKLTNGGKQAAKQTQQIPTSTKQDDQYSNRMDLDQPQI